MLAEEANTLPFPGAESNAFYAAQKQSILLYNDILDSFNTQLSTSRTAVSTAAQQYPDYYGGAYIDDDGGLVILVTDLTEAATSMQSTLRSLSTTTASVRYEQCDVSFNKILEAIAAVSDNVKLLKNQEVSVVSICDDIRNGHVLVGVKELSDEKEQIIQSVVDCNFLSFENADIGSLDAEIGGGWCPAYRNSPNGSASTIGFAAKRNGVKGFVIAGHAAAVDDKIYYVNAVETVTEVGTVKYNRYVNNSTADAAFVEAASGVTFTNELHFGGYLWDATPLALPVGTDVVKWGLKTGLTYGEITSTNAEYQFTDKIRCPQYYQLLSCKLFC